MRGARQRESAAGGRRLDGADLSLRRVGAGARILRCRGRAGPGAIPARRASRLARFAHLSAPAPGADGIRPDMTSAPDGLRDRSETIELPAPTAWPMVLALGITLAFAGLVTHAAVNWVGIALALIAAVGWWREVLPEQRTEEIALPPVELRPPAVQPLRPAVELPHIREGAHRTREPVEIQPHLAGIRGGGIGRGAEGVDAGVVGPSGARGPRGP